MLNLIEDSSGLYLACCCCYCLWQWWWWWWSWRFDSPLAVALVRQDSTVGPEIRARLWLPRWRVSDWVHLLASMCWRSPLVAKHDVCAGMLKSSKKKEKKNREHTQMKIKQNQNQGLADSVRHAGQQVSSRVGSPSTCPCSRCWERLLATSKISTALISTFPKLRKNSQFFFHSSTTNAAHRSKQNQQNKKIKGPVCYVNESIRQRHLTAFL